MSKKDVQFGCKKNGPRTRCPPADIRDLSEWANPEVGEGKQTPGSWAKAGRREKVSGGGEPGGQRTHIGVQKEKKTKTEERKDRRCFEGGKKKSRSTTGPGPDAGGKGSQRKRSGEGQRLSNGGIADGHQGK